MHVDNAPMLAPHPVTKGDKRRKSFYDLKRKFLRDWQLHLMILIPVAYLLIFNYGPMYGIQIAFKDYRTRDGIWGSEFFGLKWFEKFFNYYRVGDIIWNTISLSLYSIVAGFPIPVFLALLLNTVEHKRFKKTVQTVSYMPHFISVTIMVGILNMVFSPVNGLYGNLFRLFGGSGFPEDIRATEAAFPHLYTWSGIWASVGWSTIIYTAALSAVSPELHEAAQLDGASRWKRVLNVDLPTIMPTVAINLILRMGDILSVGFEKVYMMQTALNINASEVISTYVYSAGMGSPRDYSYGTAVGLFNSLVSLGLVLLTNWICKVLTDREVSIF